MSDVSVIIPNFNREALIGETLSNLLAQTQPPREIIVVDDGSMDKSVEVIQSFGDKIKLIQQANQGPGAARNAGMLVAEGEFIQFQDSDDLFSLNKLEVQARALETSGADIVFSPWVKVHIDQGNVRFENNVLQQRLPSGALPPACWWLRGWMAVFQSLMFRRRFLTESGSYRTDLMPSEDSEYLLRMLLRNPRMTFTDECLMLYRLHSINKITENEGISRSRRVVDWARCLALAIAHCEKAALPVDRGTRGRFLAGVRKHLKYLRAVPGDHAELEKVLSDQVATMSPSRLDALDLWLRLTEQLRLRIDGSRWITAYQVGPPTTGQKKLIGDLGLQII